MILGIDASTAGSGGAKRHLIELLKRFDPQKHQVCKVIVWGTSQMLNELPERESIIKITHPYLNKGFFYRSIWQIFLRNKSFSNRFDLLFSPFGTYSNKNTPYVSMSRNMLLFDKSERERFGYSLLRLKLFLLRLKQIKSFRNANGIIFISNYAFQTIKQQIKLNTIKTKIINHGVSSNFKGDIKEQKLSDSYSVNNPFKFLYVSSIWPYKHQIKVVKSISKLRLNNYPVSLTIVGCNDYPSYGNKLKKLIQEVDPYSEFIRWDEKVSLDQIHLKYNIADAFIFASSCENMPNILIEAMSAGLPIISSNYQPMPEFLKDSGIYFNPLKENDLEEKCIKLFINNEQRNQLSKKSKSYSEIYTWDKCADETFEFLYSILNNTNVKK